MTIHFQRLIFLACFLLCSQAIAKDLNGWEERSFEGNTQYQHITIDGQDAIKASTQGQASVLYKEQKINLNKTPLLSWRWRVENTYDSSINEKSKQGDDYPARLYVVTKTGFLPWQTLAINYVWSSAEPVDSNWPNAFTDKAQMLVIDTGPEYQNQWRTHQRNVKEDFIRLFGEQIEEINGYAVMVDGDNTGASGTAFFADIQFSSEIQK